MPERDVRIYQTADIARAKKYWADHRRGGHE